MFAIEPIVNNSPFFTINSSNEIEIEDETLLKKSKESLFKFNKNKPLIESIAEHKDGIDVSFLEYTGALKVAEYIKQEVPVLSSTVTSKLLTHDPKNNTETRNRTVLLEICPFNRGDLMRVVVSNREMLCLVNKVSSKLWLADIDKNTLFSVTGGQMSKALKLNTILKDDTFKNKETDFFSILKSKKDLKKYRVVAKAEVCPEDELALIKNKARGRWSRLKVMDEESKEVFDAMWGFWTLQQVSEGGGEGDAHEEGDLVEGYDINGCQFNDDDDQRFVEGRSGKNEVVLVGRVRDRKRRWKNKVNVDDTGIGFVSMK